MTDHMTIVRDITAEPAAVWAALADLERMREWSPEHEGIRWLGGSTRLAVGARFTGTNRHGRRSWSTTSTVTELVPGRELAFEVRVGPFKIARWHYLVEALDGRARVSESWQDRRNAATRYFSRFITGVGDRTEANRASIAETLERLARSLESGAGPA
jgi:uncharacterized protein YndB with AHSA1/START domain